MLESNSPETERYVGEAYSGGSDWDDADGHVS